MPETATPAGVALEEVGPRELATPAANMVFTHLHFDRRARTWRGVTEPTTHREAAAAVPDRRVA